MKYHNKFTTVDGIKFHSCKEANRYEELKLLERGHVIKELELQPEFLLQEGYEYQGKKVRAIKYLADFKYYDTEKKKYIVEDVKASKNFTTDVYKLKKKLLLYKYRDINFIEIY